MREQCIVNLLGKFVIEANKKLSELVLKFTK
jgi:hypothetical protein